MAVYDDQKTDEEVSPGHLEELERSFAAPSATESGSDIAQRNQEASSLENAFAAPSAADPRESAGAENDGQENQVGKGYTGPNKKPRMNQKGWFNRRRVIITGSIITALTTAIVGGYTSFLQVFSLDTYLSNIEEKATIRYQVDMDGRSSKWIQAYIALRLADIEKPDKSMDDNLYFRSTKVDTNEPLKDWYRTMRTSKFEQEVFNKNGIYFTSVAYKDGPNLRLRPALLKFDADPSATQTFHLSRQEEDVLFRKGFFDNTSLTDQYRFFNNVSSSVFDNDKAARKAIKEAVNNEVKPWQWMKRRHIRKDIQNMTGVRNWRFFENTRNRASEKLIDMQNRFLLAAIPENTKSGKFMLCLFGLNDCKVSTDPADPSNRQLAPDPNSPKDGAQQNGPDGENKVPIDDGTPGTVTEDAMRVASQEAAESATEESTALVTRKIMQQIIGKINAGSSIIQFIDSLARIDEAITTKKLSQMVTVARGTQAMGFFTTLAIARDQIRSNELTSSEFDTFMEMTNGLGNNQIWSTLNNPSSNSVAYAASTEAPADACSEEAIAKMTADSYVPLCPTLKIGGPSLSEDIENWWANNLIGKTMSPILAEYRKTIGGIVGALGDFASQLMSPLTGAFKAVLQAVGLQDVIENAVGWMLSTVSSRLGAGPMVEKPTGAAVGLLAAEGASYTNEASMRYQGAAKTTETTRTETLQQVAIHTRNQQASQSFLYRYASLSNPTSFLSRQLFSLSSSRALSSPSTFARTITRSVAGTITGLPARLSSTVGASETPQTGYEIAQMSGIQTYDFPSQCLNTNPLDMTPQGATNADELGIIPADELTWDMVNDKDAFYERLYRDEEDQDKLQSVYDCAILDTSVRGALGAQYGYESDNSISTEQSNTTIESVAKSQSNNPTPETKTSQDTLISCANSWADTCKTEPLFGWSIRQTAGLFSHGTKDGVLK